MAIYVTKRCPHCGYAYQIHQSGDQRKYGCPYQTCERCHNSYWDTDIKEPALHGYENLHEAKESIKRGIVLIFYILIEIVFLSGGIYSLMNKEMFGILFLAFAGCLAWVIVSYFKQKIYDNKHIDDIIQNQQREYDASMARLKNNNYLTALAKHDALAKQLLKERTLGKIEHYAKRPR